MIKWYEVGANLADNLRRFQELTGRDVDARAVATLRERGEYDPERHSRMDRPLTDEEWAEVLALGAALARHCTHPSWVHRAVQAGLSWEDIAEITGTTVTQVRAAYREWLDKQRRLGPELGMNASEYSEALALLHRRVRPAEAEDARAAAVRELEEIGAARRTLEERTRAAVPTARAAGVPVRLAAELAGVSPDTVVRLTEERGLELLRAGADEQTVAAETGARPETVARWVRKAEATE